MKVARKLVRIVVKVATKLVQVYVKVPRELVRIAAKVAPKLVQKHFIIHLKSNIICLQERKDLWKIYILEERLIAN